MHFYVNIILYDLEKNMFVTRKHPDTVNSIFWQVLHLGIVCNNLQLQCRDVSHGDSQHCSWCWQHVCQAQRSPHSTHHTAGIYLIIYSL